MEMKNEMKWNAIKKGTSSCFIKKKAKKKQQKFKKKWKFFCCYIFHMMSYIIYNIATWLAFCVVAIHIHILPYKYTHACIHTFIRPVKKKLFICHQQNSVTRDAAGWSATTSIYTWNKTAAVCTQATSNKKKYKIGIKKTENNTVKE